VNVIYILLICNVTARNVQFSIADRTPSVGLAVQEK